MNSQWQIDLFTGLNNASNMQDVLDVALKIVKPIGFNSCAWRSKLPIPLSNHKFSVLHSNEDSVSKKAENGFYDESPLRKHCSKTTEPLIWTGTTNDPIFLQAPDLFEEYYSAGHKGGWGQSIIENKNIYSLFFADSPNILSKKDLQHVDYKMQWIATSVLVKMNQFKLQSNINLSRREKEILRWSGDGKTAGEIGQILHLSHSTINFHLRNAMFKLDAPNKTNAIVKAIYLNLLK